jgi:glycogen operon protein
MSAGHHHRIIPGEAYPLGAHWNEQGVNFALFSAHAERVELCLFDAGGQNEVQRLELPACEDDVWHGFVPGLEPGAVYGYRVHGQFEPFAGHRFNPRKLLLDPYARRLHGRFTWHDSHFAYLRTGEDEDLTLDLTDNAPWMVKGVVDGAIARPAIRKPRIPWHQMVIYEAHPRGMTRLLPQLEDTLKGTYSGLSCDRIMQHLKALGVTTIELLPVHAFIDEHHLYSRGLTNYWGYNTLNFFTPHDAYQAGDDGPGEFRAMVDRLHDANIEVILDVVYNHSCEGNEFGPTLSFRGIDNSSYYHLEQASSRYYVNDTGCGNTFDVSHPRVMQMVMDSLRYWTSEMGVDGFRFDLAPVLGREPSGFTPKAGFFQAAAQDPQLAGSKLIAEPWDVGPGGYQLGGFPRQFSEWNDDYRDKVRSFWRGDQGVLPSFARRIHGSSDIFEAWGRKPRSSINFITSHDGFTLRDLVSYSQKHNQANGEDNKDGHNANFSSNFGIEGPTSNTRINAIRRRQQRNLLATLMLSQGIPMLQAGDERNRTQQGNNNAYCQDNELGWIDWRDETGEQATLTRFVGYLSELRARYPMLRAREYIHSPPGGEAMSILWLNAQGTEMREDQWQNPDQLVVGCFLSDHDRVKDQDQKILLVFNNSDSVCPFQLPECRLAHHWRWLLDTSLEQGMADHRPQVDCRSAVRVAPHSMALLAS